MPTRTSPASNWKSACWRLLALQAEAQRSAAAEEVAQSFEEVNLTEEEHLLDLQAKAERLAAAEEERPAWGVADEMTQTIEVHLAEEERLPAEEARLHAEEAARAEAEARLPEEERLLALEAESERWNGADACSSQEAATGRWQYEEHLLDLQTEEQRRDGGALAGLADKRCLADLTATCEQKTSDFEPRQRLHAEELEATAMDIGIICGAVAKGNAATYLSTLKDKTLNAACRAYAHRTLLDENVTG